MERRVEQRPEQQKQSYEKPQSTGIEFSAEEVLATGCKLPGGGPSRIGRGCRPGGCFARGS